MYLQITFTNWICGQTKGFVIMSPSEQKDSYCKIQLEKTET